MKHRIFRTGICVAAMALFYAAIGSAPGQQATSGSYLSNQAHAAIESGIGDPGAGNAAAANSLTNPGSEDVQLSFPIFSGKDTVSGGGGGAIINYLRDILKLLSASIGGVIVLMIVISGIQYITSFGDPKAIVAAKTRLSNSIIALVLFIMTFAIVQFLIPGGIVG